MSDDGISDDGTDPKQGHFSTSEVAERFGVTTPTVRDWIDRGILPATKIGTRHMISREDLIELAKSKYDS